MSSILWMSKQRYMNKDVLADRYGRLFHLPVELSSRIDVVAVLLDYRLSMSLGNKTKKNVAGVQWFSLNCGFLGCGIIRWFLLLLRFSAQKQNKCIVVSSDCFQVVVGYAVSMLTKTPFVVDLYDNYESFGLASAPLFKRVYRRALRKASAVTAVSITLKDKVIAESNKKCYLLESTINPNSFYKIHDVKRIDGLEADWSTVIGVGGGLDKGHDVDTLFDAMRQLTDESEGLHFVFAGNASQRLLDKCGERMHWLGLLPNEKMVEFYNSLDLTVIAMGDNDFGAYAFPQKAYEIIACQTPLVAANVGALGKLFEQYFECMYVPGDVESLKNAVGFQLEKKKICKHPIPSWSEQSTILAGVIYELV